MLRSVEHLMEELGRLPGIGPKTAERLAHHILAMSPENASRLARAIEEVKRAVRYCSRCFNLTENPLCPICMDPQRDSAQLCVVEQPRDVASIEKTAAFHGQYHVLLGRIAPLAGITPDKLTIEQLLARLREGEVREVIIATNPTLEGEGTALYLSNAISDLGLDVRVTRLARGLASGMSLEFANRAMLEDALAGRRDF